MVITDRAGALVPEGAARAERLALTGDIRLSVRLARDPAGPAKSLHALAAAPTLGDKVDLLHDRLALPPSLMRKVSPLARRGRAGLTLAYAARALCLLGRLPGAVRTLRQARRSGGAPRLDQPGPVEERRVDG